MKSLAPILALALLSSYTHAQTTLATTTTPPTSVVQATSYAPSSAVTALAPSQIVDTEGGASGADNSSFSLSSGGLIAIIVVVVVVAVFGIASLVLFVVAKRRQWDVRASIKRASRRLTGRDPGPTRKELEARKKRSGMVAGGRSDRGMKLENVKGQKKDVVVQVRGGDEEKGPVGNGTPPKTKGSKGAGWVEKLWGNDYK